MISYCNDLVEYWTAQKKRCKRKKKLNCLNVIIDTISQFPMQYKLAYTYNQKKKKRLKSKTFKVVTLVTTDRGFDH